MKNLSISLDAGGIEDRISARIRRIADPRGVAVNDGPHDVRFASGRERAIEVPPGQYVVEAYWRNGVLTTHRCVVSDTGMTDVILTAPTALRRTQSMARDFSQPSASGMFRVDSGKDYVGGSYSVFASETPEATWRLLCDHNEIERRTSITPEHRPVRRAEDLSVPFSKGSKRSWVIYWACDHWSVSSLPAAETEKGATVLRSNPDGVPFVGVVDPDMGVMTDLLPAGNAEAARRYASSTYRDLFGKGLDEVIASRPLEICAFAYAEYEKLSDNPWTEALAVVAKCHPWLPDAFIILGWRALMTAKSGDDWNTAGEFFESAVRNGVPYYNFGVRLLSEGLSLLATELPKHKASAKLVCSVSARTVRSEAFTTVSL